MKLLTLNFLTCARKTCKLAPAAFPLHPRDAELEQVESDLDLAFLTNMLPRLEWDAIKTVASELGLPPLPDEVPDAKDLVDVEGAPTQVGRDLHVLLMETAVVSGRLVCGACGHEYAVKEGIGNFLLPSHLV